MLNTQNEAKALADLKRRLGSKRYASIVEFLEAGGDIDFARDTLAIMCGAEGYSVDCLFKAIARKQMELN